MLRGNSRLRNQDIRLRKSIEDTNRLHRSPSSRWTRCLLSLRKSRRL
jgi:hypothetical protein